MTIEINSRPEVRYPMFCAWCRKLIGWSRAEHSYGICMECSEKLRAEAPLFARPRQEKEIKGGYNDRKLS